MFDPYIVVSFCSHSFWILNKLNEMGIYGSIYGCILSKNGLQREKQCSNGAAKLHRLTKIWLKYKENDVASVSKLILSEKQTVIGANVLLQSENLGEFDNQPLMYVRRSIMYEKADFVNRNWCKEN